MTRELYNFALENNINPAALDTAVNTANLIQYMDLDELRQDPAARQDVAESTGVSQEFVDDAVAVATDAEVACENCPATQQHFAAISQNYSNTLGSLIVGHATNYNFNAAVAEGAKEKEMSPAEEDVMKVANLLALIDDAALKEDPDSVAIAISKATGVPIETVKAMTDNAKQQFSMSNAFYLDDSMIMNFASLGYPRYFSAEAQAAAIEDGAADVEAAPAEGEEPQVSPEEAAMMQAQMQSQAPMAPAGMPVSLPPQMSVAPNDAMMATPMIQPQSIPVGTAQSVATTNDVAINSTLAPQEPQPVPVVDPNSGVPQHFAPLAGVQNAIKMQQDMATIDAMPNAPVTGGMQNVEPGQTNFSSSQPILQRLLGERYIPNGK